MLAMPLHAHAANPGKAHKSKVAQTSKSADEPEFTNFTQWGGVAELIDELSDQHGLQRETLKAQFSKVHYLDSVVRLINPPLRAKSKTGRFIGNALSNPPACAPDWLSGKNMRRR
jgi:hypothetical protein